MLIVTDLIVHFKVFEGVARVLNGVSIRVAEGETVSLVGETGCGKSVTVKTILRMLPVPPARIVGGRIEYKGQDVLAMPEEALYALRGREIALIPQEPMSSLNPVFSVEDQFTELIRWQGRHKVSWPHRLVKSFDGAEKQAAREKALALLERVHIPDPLRVMKSYPVELSGGMRQRVLIAMALAGDPELLIADEPGTALDVTTQEQILQLMKERVEKQNLAVLYITHNLGVARAMTERIYVMYAGEVVEEALTRELFRAPRHPYTQGLMASIPKLTGGEVVGIDGFIPDYVDPPPGCRFEPRCPYAMPECSQGRPSLIPVGPRHRVACFLYGQEQAPTGREDSVSS
ncbi:MAG: ABC transporter ATP-binding protein [Anaerolineae bacterium]